MNLYNLKAVAPGHYAIAKFDSDFNVAAIYNLRAKGPGWSCDCPAGQRAVKLKLCKHQRALPFMLGAANTERFYDIDTRTWHEPLKGTTLEHADITATEIEERKAAMPVPTVDLSGPLEALHNAIADAVGEPRLPAQPGPTQNATPIVTRRI